MGVPAAEARLWLQDAGADEAADEFAVWPINAEAMWFFIALERCWYSPPKGGLPLRTEHIERSEMLATAEMMGIERSRWPELFGKMRAMEREALAVWRAR